MTQNPPQFQRPLLKIGSILFIAGMVIAIVSTVIHPSTEDPSNHPLVFAEYASDDSWIAHISQFADGIMVFGGDFVALYRSFPSCYNTAYSLFLLYRNIQFFFLSFTIFFNLLFLSKLPNLFKYFT